MWMEPLAGREFDVQGYLVFKVGFLKLFTLENMAVNIENLVVVIIDSLKITGNPVGIVQHAPIGGKRRTAAAFISNILDNNALANGQ